VTAAVTVTQRLLALAPARPALRAVATATCGGQGAQGGTYRHSELALTIQAAAAGLAWRGLQPRDVVGVYVPDVVSYVLATHAIRAAGGVPSPVNPDLTVAGIAGQLAECGARMLLTGAPFADAALAAADRSWVRQVFSFTEAAGTIAVSALLGVGTLRPTRGRPHDNALLPFSPGADGRLRPVPVTHLQLAERTGELTAGPDAIGEQDVLLATPPSGDGVAYTAVVDAALIAGATVVAADQAGLARAAAEFGATMVVLPRGARLSAAARLRVFHAA
jgi:long-chain acyl-CoA synthetase